MVRHNNQLPENLPQLQNLIKRDPESYKEEFLQQHQHYKSILEVFRLAPNKFNKSLDEVVIFLAQVAHCYPNILESFPQEIIDVLQTYNTVLDNDMRLTFCKALIQLRNKSLLEPTVLLSLFFELLRCQDKNLRQFLQTHIIADIKNVNAKQKNAKINTTLQNFMFSMLKDSNVRSAKMSTDIMIELYNKNIWNDAKTVNVLATGCFVKATKVMVACLKFFLGTGIEEQENEESDSDSEPNIKEIIMANRVNKKTKKREKQLAKAKQLLAKSKKKATKAPRFNFSALHLIHDPQGFAEKLFKQLEKNNDRFEIKLLALDVISRLIGLHNLFLLNFYPYLQRFLQPHQREVTKLLQFIAQASHELVPPDVLEPILKTLANNFVTERNSADVMAIGLNAIREICTRCPLVMNEDLLQDLARYKYYKERSVMMAARSLITLFRNSIPELLHKKDRGRPTETNITLSIQKYGQISANDFVPGAEVLLDNKANNIAEISKIGIENNDSDDEWIDIDSINNGDCDDDDDDDDDNDDDDDDDDDDNDGDDDNDDDDNYNDHNDNNEKEGKEENLGKKKEKKSIKNNNKDVEKIENEETEMKVCENNDIKSDVNNTEIDNVTNQSQGKECRRLSKLEKKRLKLKTQEDSRVKKNEIITAEKREKATLVSNERLLTDEDFMKIDAALVKQQITYAKRGLKRAHPNDKETGEFVKLTDIENIYKKRKHDKQARIESVKKGQEGREKFGYKDGRQNPLCSKTNREKKKNKTFQMLKHKIKGKVKRSFKEKQIALRNHLLKQKRMK
ncbi:protein SDA1 homolog isoform X1 [Bombus huntii]|uniref:protein SDA1 homolog isoform X1 n=2 Tax=Bombus huntii TaxID=85661 RepID=UPI0021AAA4AF|nr:protein SDA1 homolog isoform X1 [Bombus huntii]XP_050472536.1 protein SDA1 homolog isoform X1 [Bombus huntii]XP_050472537.1 protein SDA1 homolog isoform X1 [Bombus huntii]XP_050472538.1 protein SDA1 homolog isoform X1 [Bombus huntii]